MARKAIWCRPLVEKDVAWVCLHSLNLATQQCDDMGELEWGDQRDEMNCSSEAGSTPPQNGENDVPCEIIPDLQPTRPPPQNQRQGGHQRQSHTDRIGRSRLVASIQRRGNGDDHFQGGKALTLK
ncbi:hypothetical protein EMCRGX_G020622 [Ephydatia muelleri]